MDLLRISMQLLDYSAGYPRASVIKNNTGYGGVVRYLRKEGTSSVKPITKTEYDSMIAVGLHVALVYQHVQKGRPLQGFDAGKHDALWALARARELGVEPRAIYFTADFDVTVSQYPLIGQYMQGVANVLGITRTGTYGEWGLLDWLFRNTVITWGWQTYAWSTGHNKDNEPRHPKAHLFQRLQTVVVDGVTCDVNDVLKSDFGQTVFEDDMTPEEILDAPIARSNSVLGGNTTLRAVIANWDHVVEMETKRSADLLAAVTTAVKNAVSAYFTEHPPVVDAVDYDQIALRVVEEFKKPGN